MLRATKTSRVLLQHEIPLFRENYLWSMAFSKLSDPSGSSNSDLRAAALCKFMSAEDRNLVINTVGRYWSALGANLNEQIISSARKIIRSTLGALDIDHVFQHRVPTGGGSTSRTRRVSHPIRKLFPNSRKPHVTPAALPYAYAYVNTSHALKNHYTKTFGDSGWFQLRYSSILGFVPKNTKEDRIICTEPDMNMILQRCVGATIRDKLCYVGIDIRSQEYNQILARIGSMNCGYSTIDLSAASDSISIALVRDLLPMEWFNLLMDLRCETVRLPNGKLHFLQKISSMGNGYTFELETLIFWALARACMIETKTSDDHVAVYGDDIVINTVSTQLLIDVLTYVGFVINDEKSFTTGFFRESCGGFYMQGYDVTPYFIKSLVTLSDIFHWLNKHYRWVGTEDAFYKRLLRCIPFEQRLSIPENSEELKSGLLSPYGTPPIKYVKSQNKDPLKPSTQSVYGIFSFLEHATFDITDRFGDYSKMYTTLLANASIPDHVESQPLVVKTIGQMRVRKRRLAVAGWGSRVALS